MEVMLLRIMILYIFISMNEVSHFLHLGKPLMFTTSSVKELHSLTILLVSLTSFICQSICFFALYSSHSISILTTVSDFGGVLVPL